MKRKTSQPVVTKLKGSALANYQGKTPIGSCSYIILPHVDKEYEYNALAFSDLGNGKTFHEIRSHQEAIRGYKDLHDMKDQHKLKRKFNEMSWNNVPVSVKDMLWLCIEKIVALDCHNIRRRETENERTVKI